MMELSLKYEAVGAEPSAVFLRGHDPRWWLEHFRVWGLRPADMTLLALAGTSGQEVSGLFVVFAAGCTPDPLLLPEPFIRTGKRLFIPQHTVLLPAMTDAELEALCIWDYQLLHPSLGFYGLDKADVLPPESLVILPQPVDENRDFNIAQVAPLPRIARVRMEMPEEDTLTREAKAIGSKELPPPEGAPKSWFGRKLLQVQLIAASAARSIVGLFAGNGQNGLLGKLAAWLDKKLSHLRKLQEDEADRLLRMFRENPELALEYAMPLDPNARPDGDSAASGRLVRRDARYHSWLLNRGGRGGGVQMLDGDTYQNLQEQYRKSAKTAEENGDWSRAAYIHAHLLKDYHAAAKALRSGKFFRDAAVMYHDKLENLHNAAACYQEGGMYPEAIALYLKLELYEEAGDLHVLNGDDAEAKDCYERKVAGHLKYDKYLEAAQLIEEKMHDRERAQRCLLNGWYGKSSAARCLVEYIRKADGPVHENIRRLYEEVVVPTEHRRFLDVLSELKSASPEAGETARDLAYQIVGASVGRGEKDLLPMLGSFVPEDPFLRKDALNFQLQMPALPEREKRNIDKLKLRTDIHWLEAVGWRQQIIVIGSSGGKLVLARCNWEGEVLYQNTELPLDYNSMRQLLVVSANDLDNRILVCDPYGAFASQEFSHEPAFGDGFTILRNIPEEYGAYIRIGHAERTIIRLANDIAGKHTISPVLLPPGANSFSELIHEGEISVGLARIFSWKHKYFTADSDRLLIMTDLEEPEKIETRCNCLCQSGKWLAWLDENRVVHIMDAEEIAIQRPDTEGGRDFHTLEFITPGFLVAAGRDVMVGFELTDGAWIMAGEGEMNGRCLKLFPSGSFGRFAGMFIDGTIRFFDIPGETD
ncbi:hypothetical protein [Chitinophaga caseinilytica]|uniref:MoxR-vWA-beta-propeller ternary system domain-containing protein n=1 Tax=Chitinophaga caseinilytica TaxID=2267521 RepID=A0ABZ2Z9H8_9BACT